ncbi:MAG TPA: AAA family ATPase [Clostridiaceae bacterium]|nr:AAA family ATPase [Clostridiaceae bacterium]
MICFNCGIKLHKGEDKECKACGVKFVHKCQVCNSPNPAMANYCFNCSAKLIKSDTQELVRESVLLYESRKNVAVIFADISGFTALSEKLDPEEVREIINDCFNFITKPVYEMEGTIDKYIGDCVMILFGAKYTHSDDPLRAVLCAMKMMDLIKEFSESVLSTRGLFLDLTIGINYGLVVTGEVGNYYDKDYTVMGDIVNTAQRLQSSAGKGEILVSESVYSETRDMIQYSSVKEVRVKNKENPVRCYQPLAVNRDYLRKRNTLFVGREEEFGQFNTIYNDALNSSVQCIMLIGEAGSGKTRLIKEFISRVDNSVKKIWVECNYLYQNRAYYAIANVLAAIMNISISDTNSMKQHRLISFLDYILYDSSSEEIERCYNFLGMILGLEKDADFRNLLETMSFESINRESLKQLLLFFNGVLRKNKIMIIIDDLQCADSNSIRLIKGLIENLKGTGIIFILSSRFKIDGLENFSRKGIFHTINLNGLDLANMKKFAGALLECKEIDKKLLNIIADLTGGNPLYIKELISSMKKSMKLEITNGKASINVEDLKSFLDGINNLDSINSLILSKLSDLDYKTRIILQAASVIGKEFDLSLVSYLLDHEVMEKDITGLPLQQNIIEIKTAYTPAKTIQKVFAFTHELEREVIYESILNREKKRLHKKVGEYIEKVFSDDIENYYEIAAFHFHRAGLDKKAANYYYKNAVKQKDDFNFSSAIEYFEKFIAINASNPEQSQNVSNAYREMGYMSLITEDYDKALGYLNKAISYTKDTGDRHRINKMIIEVYKQKEKFGTLKRIHS